MQREGRILLLTWSSSLAFVALYALLILAFGGGAVALYGAGVHNIGPSLSAAVVIIAYPIVCIRNTGRIAHRLVQPYNVGGAVAAENGPDWLRLSDPDTGYQIEYRTRRIRVRGITAAVEVAKGSKWVLILTPASLLQRDAAPFARNR